MPTRERLEAADCVMTDVVTGKTVNHSISRILGHRQSISALNNVGKFVPGQWRANPVVLERHTILGTPARSTGTDIYLANKGKIDGHIAAHILNACGWSPLSSNYGFHSMWNSGAAGHSLQKAYASVNEADLDVGVMLGELRETIAGLANPLSALRTYAKLANKLRKRGKGPKPTDTLNMLTGNWLEWRYGIQPLILTVSAIIEHVQAKSFAMSEKLLSERGKVKTERNFSVSGSSGPGLYFIAGKVHINVKTQYTSKVYYKMMQPLTWQEQYGVDLRSLPGIAWELWTLSFVWDWFFSVGDWLGSLKASDARSVVGSVTSQKSTIVADVSTEDVKFCWVTPAKITPGTLRVTYEKLDRRINQPLPLGPVVNRESLSLKRQIDALSLLWQQMPKIRR